MSHATDHHDIETSGILSQPPELKQPLEHVNWLALTAFAVFMLGGLGAAVYFMTREQPCSSVIAAYENRPAIQRPTAQEAVQYRQCKR